VAYDRTVSEEIEPTRDDDISVVVARLSRPTRGGRRDIERAAIMAEGSRSAAILAWLEDASWTPEERVVSTAYRGGAGLHGARIESERSDAHRQAPQRYVSPPTDAT
jgi:hypothetical protein